MYIYLHHLYAYILHVNASIELIYVYAINYNIRTIIILLIKKRNTTESNIAYVTVVHAIVIDSYAQDDLPFN